jgi:hypothetical protein
MTASILRDLAQLAAPLLDTVDARRVVLVHGTSAADTDAVVAVLPLALAVALAVALAQGVCPELVGDLEAPLPPATVRALVLLEDPVGVYLSGVYLVDDDVERTAIRAEGADRRST